jgi:hypothetical protein
MIARDLPLLLPSVSVILELTPNHHPLESTITARQNRVTQRIAPKFAIAVHRHWFPFAKLERVLHQIKPPFVRRLNRVAIWLDVAFHQRRIPERLRLNLSEVLKRSLQFLGLGFLDRPGFACDYSNFGIG